MSNNDSSYFNFSVRPIYILLWAPFLITIVFTIESLYYLAVVFDKVFLLPDLFILELLFFTLMIPITYWHKDKWIALKPIHKKLFLILLIIGAINFLKYIFVLGFSLLYIMENVN
jgi:hypothetical protein